MCTLGSGNLGRRHRILPSAAPRGPLGQATQERSLTANFIELVRVLGGCTNTQEASSSPQVRK